jgi:hypothetical protein
MTRSRKRFLRGEHNIVTAVSEFIHQCVQQNEEHEDAPDLTEFEQGMIFGKLAALEWIEGGEWNSLIKIVNREADDPFNIRRSHRDILRIIEQLTEKVWWNRHQIWLENISAGTEQIGCKRFLPEPKRLPAGSKGNMENEILVGMIWSGECSTVSFPRCDG